MPTVSSIYRRTMTNTPFFWAIPSSIYSNMAVVARSTLVYFLLFGISTACAASDGSLCNALLDNGLQNIRNKYGAEGSVSLNHSQNCGVDYSSLLDEQLGSIEVQVFGYGGGGANYGRKQREDRLKQWCTENSAFAKSHREEAEQSKTIYGDSVRAWESCHRMYSNDLRVIPQISPDNLRIDIGMRYVGAAGRGVYFQGVKATGFNCEVRQSGDGGNTINIEAARPIYIDRQQLNISCDRNAPQRISANGTTYEYTQKGYISVLSAGETLQLSFDEIYKPLLPEQLAEKLRKELDGLRSDLGNTKSALNALQGALSAFQNEINARVGTLIARADSVERGTKYIFSDNRVGCPNGWTTKGYLGMIAKKDQYDATNLGGGGDFNDGWRWTHPLLCVR